MLLGKVRQRSRAMFHCVCQVCLLGGVTLSAARQHRVAFVSASNPGLLKCWTEPMTSPTPQPPWRCGPTRAMDSSFLRFLDHTQRRITVGRTPLDEWSARRRDLYLTIHNTLNRQTFMPPVGFEPTIPAGERLQTHALDRAATGTGRDFIR